MKKDMSKWAMIAMIMHLSACSFSGPAPWDKQWLAKSAMSFDDSSHQSSAESHIYQSKENAFGQADAGGGGCGCN